MDRHTPERFNNFEEKLTACPEVLECYLITGQSADYVLKVLVEDMDAYQQFLLGTLTRIEGVNGVHSSFVMRKVVDRTAIQFPDRVYIRDTLQNLSVASDLIDKKLTLQVVIWSLLAGLVFSGIQMVVDYRDAQKNFDQSVNTLLTIYLYGCAGTL